MIDEQAEGPPPDPHAPFVVFSMTELEGTRCTNVTHDCVDCYGLPRERWCDECIASAKWGVYDAREGEAPDFLSAHPSEDEARRVAEHLNGLIPKCGERKDRHGSCTVCGEPDWDLYAEEQAEAERQQHEWEAEEARRAREGSV
jgi:hypothetical protein